MIDETNERDVANETFFATRDVFLIKYFFSALPKACLSV